MTRAEALGHQHVQRLAHELLGRVSEQRLGVRVGELDPPVFAHDHAAIGNELEEARKLLRCDERDRSG
jgi:hypothetical protein